MVANPEPGSTYVPDDGEHKGHTIRVLSNKGLRFNCLGQPLLSTLVRCEVDGQSWAFARVTDDPSDHWGDG